MMKKQVTSATARKTASPRSVAASHRGNARSASAGGDRKAPTSSATAAARAGKRHAGRVTNVVRDSFTMPLFDYELIGALKTKCIGLGFAVKKSELLRAGLHALTRISDDNLTQVVGAVERVKTGRPKGKKKKRKTNRAKRKKQ